MRELLIFLRRFPSNFFKWDRFLLGLPLLTEKRFIRTKLMTVQKGPGIKCRTPPQPPASLRYVALNHSLGEYSHGDRFYFGCEKTYYIGKDLGI